MGCIEEISLPSESKLSLPHVPQPAVWCLQKYNHLFERNEKDGTFYLQSKVYRARERLEQEWGVNLEEATGQRQQQAAEAQQQSRNTPGQD